MAIFDVVIVCDGRPVKMTVTAENAEEAYYEAVSLYEKDRPETMTIDLMMVQEVRP